MAAGQPDVATETLEGSSQSRAALAGNPLGNVDHVDVSRLFLDHGADPMVTDATGQTAADYTTGEIRTILLEAMESARPEPR